LNNQHPTELLNSQSRYNDDSPIPQIHLTQRDNVMHKMTSTIKQKRTQHYKMGNSKRDSYILQKAEFFSVQESNSNIPTAAMYDASMKIQIMGRDNSWSATVASVVPTGDCSH